MHELGEHSLDQTAIDLQGTLIGAHSIKKPSRLQMQMQMQMQMQIDGNENEHGNLIKMRMKIAERNQYEDVYLFTHCMGKLRSVDCISGQISIPLILDLLNISRVSWQFHMISPRSSKPRRIRFCSINACHASSVCV